MTIEKRFPEGSPEREKLKKVFTKGVINMMDSDRPNNYLIGGLNVIGTTRAFLESKGKKTVKEKYLSVLINVAESVARVRATQLGWTPEDVDEEIARGVQIFKNQES